MYDNYNEQDRSSSEYHYSYRSDSDGFQPQPPSPEVKPPGGTGRARSLQWSSAGRCSSAAHSGPVGI